MKVASSEDFAMALARAKELASSEGPQAACDFLAGCEGEPSLIVHLRAETLSQLRDDKPSLLQAEADWRELGPESRDIAFQLACVLQNLIEYQSRQESRAAVIEQEAQRLREGAASLRAGRPRRGGRASSAYPGLGQPRQRVRLHGARCRSSLLLRPSDRFDRRFRDGPGQLRDGANRYRGFHGRAPRTHPCRRRTSSRSRAQG